MPYTKKAPQSAGLLSRGGQIRTDDLLVPNQARYRATLHPEFTTHNFKILQLVLYLRPWRQKRHAIPGYATPRGDSKLEIQQCEPQNLRTQM